MIGVEGVAQAEGVGERAEPDEHGLGGGEVQEQAPADDVQSDDRSSEAGQPPPLSRRERFANSSHLDLSFVSNVTLDHATCGRAFTVMTTPMATMARADSAGTSAVTPAGMRSRPVSRLA